jgi:hypothetical protein
LRKHASFGFGRWLREALFEFFGQIAGMILRSTMHVAGGDVAIVERSTSSIFNFERRLRKFFILRRKVVQLASGQVSFVVSNL